MNFLISSQKGQKDGLSLIETLIAVSLFVIVSMSIYGGFTQLMRGLAVLEIKNKAISLANEKIEIARNLPYGDVGILNGIPSGKLLSQENIERGGTVFNVVTAVRNIDDPFDGTFDGNPQDEDPNDYKLVQIEISCPDCLLDETITFYTRVSPQALETGGDTGALFIRVLDSYGQPISGADVSIFSDDSTSTINIQDVSDNEGYLRVYEVPPGIEAYEISVSKEGYSSEQTYPTGSPTNPLPDRPHLNVLVDEITTASFAIDELSYLSIRTREEDCSSVPNVDFSIFGSKTIGYDVYKYDTNLNSGGSGRIDIDELEWDNYTIDVTDDNYELYGASTLLPIKVNPNTDQSVNLVIGPKDPNMLLVQVQDTSTNLPLSNAEVTLSKSGYEEIKMTGNGFINQTDWSGGPGQEEYFNESRFDSTDNNVDYSIFGQIVLDTFNGDYLSGGWIESSIMDLGTTSNFLNINWLNEGQPANTSAKFQLATHETYTATSTWDFVGPSGSDSNYYNTAGESIYSGHNGDRYLKYKAFLESESATSTPLISDVNFTFSSDCVAPGQVMFSDLDPGIYYIKVERAGYTTFEMVDLEVSEEWEILNVPMTR